MVTILIMSAKMAALKIEVFWNKVYDVIISAHDVTRNYHVTRIVDVVMWLKFGNCSTSMREVITSIF